jgi:hypothetical protein
VWKVVMMAEPRVESRVATSVDTMVDQKAGSWEYLWADMTGVMRVASKADLRVVHWEL